MGVSRAVSNLRLAGTSSEASLDLADPRVSVITPTLNEAANLPYVFADLPTEFHEVIVVDGFSTDGRIDVAESLRADVRIVRQNRRGKGDALRCGFLAATGDIVVMLDADGSADPREIPRFVEVLQGGADFAKGSRFIAGGGSPILPVSGQPAITFFEIDNALRDFVHRSMLWLQRLLGSLSRSLQY